MLQENNADQDDGQDGPEDDKDPDVDLLVGDAQDACPINQHIHAPVEDLIHHSFLHKDFQEPCEGCLEWALHATINGSDFTGTTLSKPRQNSHTVAWSAFDFFIVSASSKYPHCGKDRQRRKPPDNDDCCAADVGKRDCRQEHNR